MAHDKENKIIVPISEFITCTHTEDNIARRLDGVVRYLRMDLGIDSYLPKIVVTDFSWALINSICDVFNHCTVVEYLNICFDGLREQKIRLEEMVILNICHVHFLKLMIKNAKTHLEKKCPIVQKCFKFSIVLIQESQHLNEAYIMVKHSHNIFNRKRKHHSIMNSIDYLADSIHLRNRSLLEIDKNSVESPQQKEHKNSKSKCEIFD